MSTNFINLPSHPERRVIINIGSNAAVEPIVIPFHCPSGYTIGKTAFIRLSRITLSSRGIWANRGIEYLHDENSRSGVNTYLFHPGAVLTDLLRDKMPSGSEQMAVDSPFLAGGLAVWFASELSDEKINRGWLGGRYISAIWDVNEILEREKEIVEKDLLRMRLDM